VSAPAYPAGYAGIAVHPRAGKVILPLPANADLRQCSHYGKRFGRCAFDSAYVLEDARFWGARRFLCAVHARDAAERWDIPMPAQVTP